ncbi:MAG: type II secretion system protein [Planctomycetota bacterium]|nr:type II secretion system protein [Planctomycetota bacterium]
MMWRPGTNSSQAGPAPAFTLLELLVVTSIIMILIATLVTATMGVRKSVKRKATQRLIRQVSQAVSMYYDRYKAYPPDGYDFEVKVYDRVIQGSQCLVYYLCVPQPKSVKGPDGKAILRPQDPLLTDLLAQDLVFPLNEIETQGRIPELRDSFGGPILYDRVGKIAEYSYPLQHLSHPDPRPEDGPTVMMGKYQIWSVGLDYKEKEGDSSDDVLGWNLDNK